MEARALVRWPRLRGDLGRRAGPSLVGVLQSFDADLPHLEHRRHDAFRFFGVLVLQHLAQDGRNDLPRHTEPVLEPPALYFLAARRELRPEVVYVFLRLAVHDERYRLGEFEDRPAVQRRELLPIELECHRHDRALRSSGGLCRRVVIAGDARYPGILEDRDVELRGLFGLMIEPQKRRDSLQRFSHRVLPYIASTSGEVQIAGTVPPSMTYSLP